MDQNNGLVVKISKEETRTTIMMELREFHPLLIRISLQDQTSHMGTKIRIMGDFVIIAQINRSIEAMGTSFEMDLSAIRTGTGETMEKFLVLYRLKRETSEKSIYTTNQEVINLTILLSAYLTIDIRPFLHITNKKFHETLTKCHLRWIASPQPTVQSLNYQTVVR